MKKVFYVLITFLVIFLTGCSNSSLKKITLDELKEKINNKETFIVYFQDDDNSFEKDLDSITLDYNLTTYKIDTSKISSNEKNDFQTIIDFETPSIVFVINGLDSSKLSHVTNTDMTKKEIIARLKDMNFIK